jgi:hypothetical protein
VTDEEPELVEKWILKSKAAYPIVILENRDFESFLNVKGFPTAAVIGPEGTLDWVGSAGATSGPVSKALSGAKKGSIWPKKLSKVAKLMGAGDYAKSYAEIRKLVEGGKLAEGEELEMGRMFQAYLEDQAAAGLAAGRAAQEAGRVYEAVQAVERFVAAKPAFPATADCKALLAELKAMPTFKKEMKGGAMMKEAAALVGEREYTEAVELYLKVMKSCKGAQVADLARAEAQSLVDEGMPGYKGTCDACMRARKACSKHHEDVKL